MRSYITNSIKPRGTQMTEYVAWRSHGRDNERGKILFMKHEKRGRLRKVNFRNYLSPS